MPGVMGGLVGALSVALVKEELYGDNINSIFPAMKDGRS